MYEVRKTTTTSTMAILHGEEKTGRNHETLLPKVDVFMCCCVGREGRGEEQVLLLTRLVCRGQATPLPEVHAVGGIPRVLEVEDQAEQARQLLNKK